MKKSTLCLLTYGFISLFIGSMVIDSYILATIGYLLAMGLLFLIVSSFNDFKTNIISDLLLFAVQYAIIFAIGNAETCLIIFLLSIYNTLMYEILQNLSITSAKRVLQTSTNGIVLELLLLIVVNGILCSLLDVKDTIVYHYLPILVILFMPMLCYSVNISIKALNCKNSLNKNVYVK